MFKIILEMFLMLSCTALVLLAIVLVMVVPGHYLGNVGRFGGSVFTVICLVGYVLYKEGKNYREQGSERKIG